MLLQLSIAASAALFGCLWLCWKLLGQNGRILLRVEQLERRLDPLNLGTPNSNGYGLPLGSRAPAFDLADLYGRRKTLADFRGQSLLLIFFDPGCGFCRDFAPTLAALRSANRHLLPLIISKGDAKQNRQLFARHKLWFSVLLQQESNVLSAYGATGTPSGYLIDPDGKIASEFALGAERLLALAGSNGFRNHSLAKSTIKRDGLNAGTVAPDFYLPRLNGRGDLSLRNFRGRRVLIVFSSPHCEPCNELAPKLERFHRARPDVDVLMISKGDPSENWAKAREHGLSFPVVMQQGWTTSRSYAIFATPAAYLIDRDGVIAHEAAVGVEPILDLMASIVPAKQFAAHPFPLRNGFRKRERMTGMDALLDRLET